jgi:hypothetical protein
VEAERATMQASERARRTLVRVIGMLERCYRE